jgi:hypothetical protein
MELQTIANALNSISPLGLAAALAYIIYLQVKTKRDVKVVSNNHLSGLPQLERDVQELVTITKAQNQLLQTMNDNIIYIKARTNGTGKG